LAGEAYLRRRDRLDLEADVGDELIEVVSATEAKAAFNEDPRLKQICGRDQPRTGVRDRPRIALGFRLEEQDGDQRRGIDHHQRGRPRSS
jgi:hypothetical protein